MNETLAPALARRLAAYSATAGVALAVTPAVDAQVVYHDFDPDIVLEGTSPASVLDLDLDDDGTPDLRLRALSDPDTSPLARPGRANLAGADRYYFIYVFSLRVPPGANPQNGVLGYYAGYYVDCASRLRTGEHVGPAQPGQAFHPSAAAAYSEYSNGRKCPFLGQEGYAGFRFVAGDGDLRYGWLRLAASDNADTGWAYEYAYEATPETPIVVGTVSAAILTGSVDQAQFPPEGGTLRYTFTIENITTEPLPLDLWVEHFRDDVGPERVRLLGSGTLPPRARVTRTVALPVPAGAPAGSYDVRFKVGDFEAEQFRTFQRFTVVKGAPSGAAGEEADLFAAAPRTGDLFASAGGPAEGAAEGGGSHTLSAPSPNPSTGRTEFTLEVAEAQVVRVEVLDALGRRVALLHEGALSPGTPHRLLFDEPALPSGVYVVRAVGETFSDLRVLTLAR